MEADAYERINSALTSRLRRTNLPIRSSCGIDRIVWSVWDYIVGPELRFVWDVVPSELDQLTAPLADTSSDSGESTNTANSSVDQRSQCSGGEFINHYHENSLDPMSRLSNENLNSNFDEDNSRSIVAEIHACGRCLKSNCDGGVNCILTNMSEFVERALKFGETNEQREREREKFNKIDGENKMTTSTSNNSSPGDPLQSSQSTIVDSETSDSLVDAANAPLANLKLVF